MKKAQGISISTIIIAAIALIVLVVLIAIFTGRMGIWGQGLDDITRGTPCVEETDDNGKVIGAGGIWKAKCEEGERHLLGPFIDAKNNPGLQCCKAN